MEKEETRAIIRLHKALKLGVRFGCVIKAVGN